MTDEDEAVVVAIRKRTRLGPNRIKVLLEAARRADGGTSYGQALANAIDDHSGRLRASPLAAERGPGGWSTPGHRKSGIEKGV